MTLNEFKAWFDGFTEDMEGPPKAKQWARIQERVKEITGNPVSYPVYVDRYWNRPYWSGQLNGLPYNGSPTVAGSTGGLTSSVGGLGGYAVSYSESAAASFNPIGAMYAAGKADAQDLALT